MEKESERVGCALLGAIYVGVCAFMQFRNLRREEISFVGAVLMFIAIVAVGGYLLYRHFKDTAICDADYRYYTEQEIKRKIKKRKLQGWSGIIAIIAFAIFAVAISSYLNYIYAIIFFIAYILICGYLIYKM